MKKNQTICDEIKNKIAKPAKRFFVSIADCLIILIIGIITFSTIGINLMAQLPSFQDKVNTFNTGSDACLQLYYDSHLGVKNGDSNLSNEDICYLSIKNYVSETFYDENGKSSDNLIYFYTIFCPMKNLTKDKKSLSNTISWVNTNIYKYGETFSTTLWKSGCDINKPLYLSNEAKSLLSDYINGIRTSDVQSCYNNLNTLFLNGLVSAQTDLVNSDLYKTHMNICENIYPYILQYYSITAIINYVAVYAIFFIVIPLFSSNGQTLMKRLFKIGLYNEDLSSISKKKIILRNSLGVFLYFFLVPLLAIPAITSAFLYLPLLIINGTNIYLSYFVIGSLVLSLASIIYMFIDKKNRNFHDAICKCLVLNASLIQKNNIIAEDEYEKNIKKMMSEASNNNVQ